MADRPRHRRVFGRGVDKEDEGAPQAPTADYEFQSRGSGRIAAASFCVMIRGAARRSAVRTNWRHAPRLGLDRQPASAPRRAFAYRRLRLRRRRLERRRVWAPDTESEQGPWFEYPIGGISVQVALEPGASEMVSVTVDGASSGDREMCEWLANIMRNWHLTK